MDTPGRANILCPTLAALTGRPSSSAAQWVGPVLFYHRAVPGLAVAETGKQSEQVPRQAAPSNRSSRRPFRVNLIKQLTQTYEYINRDRLTYSGYNYMVNLVRRLHASVTSPANILLQIWSGL